MLRRALLCLSLLLAAAPLSAQTTGASGIKFKGVVVEGDEVKVCLVNLATNKAKWLPIGSKFGGYVIKSCAATLRNPYVVLAPPTGRGAETILRLEEVAAPVNALPVVTPITTVGPAASPFDFDSNIPVVTPITTVGPAAPVTPAPKVQENANLGDPTPVIAPAPPPNPAVDAPAGRPAILR
jgi:hypothetical protein